MRNTLLIAFATFIVGFGGTVVAVNKMGLGTDKASTQVAVNSTMLRKFPNGTIIYEESPDRTDIEDIAPAAGGPDEDVTKPIYKYNPLTQTFRAVGRKEIINTNTH
jgi:hypothetical protein